MLKVWQNEIVFVAW